MNMWKSTSDYFLRGINTENLKERDIGGPECAEYLTFEFRVTTTVIMVKIDSNHFLDICIFCSLQNDK
jgi:hypothetical protein